MSECPRCSCDRIRKNGLVRGLQRYRCLLCGFNFVEDYKNRWPSDSKLLCLMEYRIDGISMSAIAKERRISVQTISRWMQDAQEPKQWFVEAIADQMIFTMMVESEMKDDGNKSSLDNSKFLDELVLLCAMIVGPEFIESAARTARLVVSVMEERLEAEKNPFRPMDVHEVVDHLKNIAKTIEAELPPELRNARYR